MNNTLSSPIPTEVYLGFLGRTIEIPWSYHAILMFSIWFVLVPIGIITIRYFKPESPGPRASARRSASLTGNGGGSTFISTCCISRLYYRWEGRGSGRLDGKSRLQQRSIRFLARSHNTFAGAADFSAWTRGSHGGRHCRAKADQPETWVGDHYDMTPRRRRFEAYHKTAGYCAGFFAVGCVTGFDAISDASAGGRNAGRDRTDRGLRYLDYQGRRYDTYRAVFGNDPEHPHNAGRKSLWSNHRCNTVFGPCPRHHESFRAASSTKPSPV